MRLKIILFTLLKRRGEVSSPQDMQTDIPLHIRGGETPPLRQRHISCNSVLMAILAIMLASCQPKPEVAPPVPTVPEPPAVPVLPPPPPPPPPVETKKEEPPVEEAMPSLRQLFRQAVASFRQGDWVQAQFQLEILAGNYPILGDYVLHYLAQAKYKLGDYPGAAYAWQQLLEGYPLSRFATLARLGLADSYAICLDYSMARDVYKELANQQVPDRAELEYKLAQCLENDQDYSGAMTWYYDVWLRYPASNYAALANERKQVLSRDYGMIAPELTDEESWSRINKLINVRKYKAAIAEIMEFCTRFSDSSLHGQAHLKLALCYKWLKQSDLAVESLLTAIDLYPGKPESAEAYYYLAKICWNSGKNEEALTAFEQILKHPQGQQWKPETYYLIARIYEEQGNPGKAMEYNERLVERYPADSWAQSAYWRLGWINYQLARYQHALDYFRRVRSGNSLFRSAVFWQGRAAENLKDLPKTGDMYNRIIREFPFSYYAYLSEQRLSKLAGEIQTVDSPVASQNGNKADIAVAGSADNSSLPILADPFDLKYYLSPAGGYYLQRSEELVRLLEFEAAQAELDLAVQNSSPEGNDSLYLLSQLYRMFGNYNKAMQISQRMVSNYPPQSVPPQVREHCYPRAYGEYLDNLLEPGHPAQNNPVDPYLALAVMKQESAFNPRAQSSANAMGLMQIIPATGQRQAVQTGLADFQPAMLYEPKINISLGINYLAELMRRYKNNLVLALAAYNAGESAVDKWVARYPMDDPFQFIENIPYQETRNYVKQVISNYLNYLKIYGKGENRVSFY